MSAFLLKLLELSLQAGALTLGILFVRLVFRKLPAKYFCLLWAIVAVRLVVPFSFETGIAWAPNFQTLWSGEEENKYKEIYTEFIPIGDARVDYAENRTEKVKITEIDESEDYYLNGSSKASGTVTDIYAELVEEHHTVISDADSINESDYYIVASPTPVPEGIANATFRLAWRALFYSVTPMLFGLWLLGMVILLGYGAFSYIRVKRLVRNAIPYEDNIWLCEGLQTPFLFGWRNPQIYLPTNMEEAQIQYVVEHEKAHIARGDNYTKIIGYVLLSVYWFNPLIWVAYVVFCKDVERACDERVIGGFSPEDRKGYAEALLECSVDRKFGISNPLAFGEMDVKKRITGILQYKKPGKWLIVIAMLLCLTAAAGCFFVKEKRPTLVMGPSPTPTPTPTVAPTNPPRGDGPYTPVPTVGPSSEQRGDGPYTPTPTPAATNITPTPLPPSDLTLLGNCTEETVLPVPFGRTVSIDLNGDGIEEAVTFGLEGYEGNVSFRDLEEAHKFTYEKVEDLYYLQINERVWSQPEIEEEFWSHYGVGTTTYYIFDVDTSDKYKEIGIFFPGPNTPTGVALYRYFNGELYCIGNFMSPVLEADHGYGAHSLPYEEMVTKVKREGYLISVPGDGTIFCEERSDLLETSFAVQKYKLSNASSGRYAQLKQVLRERYEFSGWQDDRQEFNVRAAKDFTAYFSPVDMSQEFHKDFEAVKIPEGTRTSFYAYYPDNGWTTGWVQFAYGENLDKFAWFYKGVDATGRFMIYLPDATEKSVEELFDNLNHAG